MEERGASNDVGFDNEMNNNRFRIMAETDISVVKIIKIKFKTHFLSYFRRSARTERLLMDFELNQSLRSFINDQTI